MVSPAGREEWCASVRAARDEAIRATAPELISTWLLVEHPGPWPTRGFPADLDEATARVLHAAEERGVRVQFIRRVRERRREPRQIIVAGRGDGRGDGRGWAERRVIAHGTELAALDLDALAAGRPPGFGVLVDAQTPVVLVCTHGRRDVCCARLGRPVAVGLDEILPEQVWETTHVGGDRFAANVVTLPGGHYHGGLTAPDVPRMAAALRSGELVLDLWRGECGTPAEQQAAAYFVRRMLDRSRIGGVRAVLPAADAHSAPVEAAAREPEVRITADGTGEFVVRVRRMVLDARRTSCAEGGTTGTPAGYDLVSLTPSGSTGTTIGEPVIGSGIVMQSMPKTADTVSGVITSAGAPEA